MGVICEVPYKSSCPNKRTRKTTREFCKSCPYLKEMYGTFCVCMMKMEDASPDVPVTERFQVTDKRWLQNEKNLIGKTLCIIKRASKSNKEAKQLSIFFPRTIYVVDIEKIRLDSYNSVDYLHGKKIINIDYAPAPDWDPDAIPSISVLDTMCIDYFHPGQFENYEYWIVPREEAIEEIKKYNRQIIGDLYQI